MATLTKKRLMAPSEGECEMEDGGSYCGSKKMKDGGYKRMMDKATNQRAVVQSKRQRWTTSGLMVLLLIQIL
jgi:hypothetical protein